MNITDFVATVTKGGISRENRFNIAGPGTPGEPLNALVQNASLPGLSLYTYSQRNIGLPFLYPYDWNTNELQLTFIDTANQDIQKFYVDWVAATVGTGGNLAYEADTGFAYANDEGVRRQVNIQKLDRNNDVTMEYQVLRAYPINIGNVSLQQASLNTPSILTITFAFDYWETVK